MAELVLYNAPQSTCSQRVRFVLNTKKLPFDEVKLNLLEGDQLTCPRHGARFCIRTGEALTPPAYEPAAVFPVRVQGGMVQTRDDRRN